MKMNEDYYKLIVRMTSERVRDLSATLVLFKNVWARVDRKFVEKTLEHNMFLNAEAEAMLIKLIGGTNGSNEQK